METAATPTQAPYMLLSSTGMLHTQGCPALTIMVSQVTRISEEQGATHQVRCMVCGPRPLGQAFTAGPRGPEAAKADTKADQAARAARFAEATATWAAMQSPELDAALQAFTADECQATWDAMQALAPQGWSPTRRQNELQAS